MKDRELKLLTSFVDGELSNRERKQLHRLLHRSSEARAILAQLQENAHAMKQLTVHSAPADLTEHILASVARARPPVRQPAPTGRPVPYRQLAWAAAALLLVSGSLVALLARREQEPTKIERPLARAPKKDEPGIPLRDLQESKQQELFAQELQRRPSVHIDLRVSDSARVATRVQQSLEKGGIQVHVVGNAQDSLKRGSKAEYVVYLENVMPDEVAGLLARLAREESMSSSNNLLVHSMDADDRKLLSGLLGVDESKFELRDRDPKLMLDNFPDTPQDAKSSTSNTLPPKYERHAVLLLASGDARESPQVKSYLSQRHAARPGTVQVLLLLRDFGV